MTCTGQKRDSKLDSLAIYQMHMKHSVNWAKSGKTRIRYWCQSLIGHAVMLCMLPYKQLKTAEQAIQCTASPLCWTTWNNIPQNNSVSGEISAGNEKSQEENKKIVWDTDSQVLETSSEQVCACLSPVYHTAGEKVFEFVKSQLLRSWVMEDKRKKWQGSRVY